MKWIFKSETRAIIKRLTLKKLELSIRNIMGQLLCCISNNKIQRIYQMDLDYIYTLSYLKTWYMEQAYRCIY